MTDILVRKKNREVASVKNDRGSTTTKNETVTSVTIPIHRNVNAAKRAPVPTQ